MAREADIRVFLDSNVIFSGLYSSKGAPGIILDRFISGRLTVVLSRQVLEEVVRTIKRAVPEVLPSLEQLLVNCPPEVVKDPSLEELKKWLGLMNPGDAPILGAALSAQPDYFITGDKHLFASPQLSKKSGLRFVTPAEFLRLTGNK